MCVISYVIPNLVAHKEHPYRIDIFVGLGNLGAAVDRTRVPSWRGKYGVR